MQAAHARLNVAIKAVVSALFSLLPRSDRLHILLLSPSSRNHRQCSSIIVDLSHRTFLAAARWPPLPTRWKRSGRKLAAIQTAVLCQSVPYSVSCTVVLLPLQPHCPLPSAPVSERAITGRVETRAPRRSLAKVRGQGRASLSGRLPACA